MKHEAEQFLASDLLENYLMGTTTFEENQKVEHFIATYPEVAAQYRQLQEDLEAYARSFAVKAPLEVRENVMSTITKKTPRKSPAYLVAASAAAVIFAVSTFYFWDQNTTLRERNATINAAVQQLEEDMKSNETTLGAIREQFALINDPGTQKYILKGNEKAEKLRALAYVNPEERTSYINVLHLPELPEDQCYQMWADIDGEMISMAILENTENTLVALPYKENAASYNITVEPKGGNDHATVENLVANVFITAGTP